MASSASSVAESLGELSRLMLDEVHVCGLGVWCPWSDMEKAGLALKKKGASIYWHCGRGYLDAEREQLERFSIPVLVEAGTNTAAVGKFLGVDDRAEAELLMALAWSDSNVKGAPEEEVAPGEQTDWLDLIKGAMAQYLKYQDRDAYPDAIRQLADGQLDETGKHIAERFRRTGYQYILHGRSAAMRQLKRRIVRCADADRHVLITGESGVGKEHVAHLLRERSPRFMGPFIPVNCALYASNSNLANSDLFGHLKGAFTGAEKARNGRFVEADHGILFLDEIGELPLTVQAKLLRVLEDGWVTPEGADTPAKKVDVRIIAATNLNLPQCIREGKFRADLFHRMATLRLHVPPLRERAEDIAQIAMERLNFLKVEGRPKKLGKKELAILKDYEWPGNVRQLIKLIDRAVLLEMSLDEVIAEEKDLGELRIYDSCEGKGQEYLTPMSRAQVSPIKDIEKRYARHVFELFEQNYTATAKALGVQTNTLRYSLLGEK